jgi:hypothetical protein
MGEPFATADCLLGLACLASAVGEAQKATRLFSAQEALREAIGITPSGDRALSGCTRATLHEQLGEDAFAAAWENGRAVPLDDAVAEALALADELAVRASPENGAV